MNISLEQAQLTLFSSDTKTPEQTKEAIAKLEEEMLLLPQLKLEAKHYLANGLYARELFMPKGSVVTGRIHLKEHICVISFGDVTVVENEQSYRVRGPCTFVGKPGSKRALLLHEDTLWTAIHATDKKTVEECEASLTTNDYSLVLGVQ